MNFLLLHQLIFFVSSVIGVGLSCWVFFSGKKRRVARLFSAMVLLWVIGEMFLYFVFRNFSLSKQVITFLPKLEIFFVFIFFLPFYLFTITFLEEKEKFSALTKLVVSIGLIGALLALFTNLFPKEVLMENGQGLDLILTPQGKVLWLGFVILMSIFIFFRFVLNYFRASGKKRLQIQYFLAGFSYTLSF